MAKAMMWFVVIGVSLLPAASAVAQTQACVSATGRQVAVSGTATIAMKPDRVSFTVGVETQAADVAEAFRKNSARVNAVIAALKQHGVKPAEIETSNLSIDSRDETGKRLAGYRVSNLVSVTREDPTSVGELLQVAVSAGANQAGNLRFFVAEPQKVLPRGLEMAFQNAREKAQRLATLSGRTLGEIVCVTDTSSNYPSTAGYAAFENITVTASAPEIGIGEQSLSFSVSATFELK